MLNPWAIFLILLGLGIAAGLIFDRLVGPGWLTRQIVGSTRMLVTSSLVGIAGSFIGGHLAGLIGIRGYGAFVGAMVGALAVQWGWRMLR